ncbi:TRAP transporter substrate-binding protein [Nesterenkonia sp. Act20]|uniref:TRAP transporter substrate-binding protein n=1 Tax=Nesterenkonia sp. Act20 TaxID=1483432 RepID=UPI001C46325E|nr:TRAP transporter substrate-binding protein [Nesterenkonia sp. Act20]
MTTNRMISTGIASLAVVSLAACGSSSEGGEEGGDGAASSTAFRVAFNQNEGHPQAQVLEQVSEGLSEQTDGQYSLDLYTDETLGDQAATIEQVQSGTIEFSMVAGSLLESYEPDFAVANLPYLYESPEHQMEVLNDTELMSELYESVEDDNIKVLAAYHGGVRNVYSSEGPVNSPEDLSGQQIRVIGSDTNVRMMELMGGVGNPMAQGEVYTAIQSGVIEGGENNELIYSSLSHDEIAPYYSYTEHLMLPDFLVMSLDVWEGLDEEAQQTLMELLDESVDEELALFSEAVEEARASSEEAGAEFNDVDVEAFREAVMPLHEEAIESDRAQAIYDAIESARSDS